MTRHLVIFAACFLLGAVVTAAIRTSRHQPYQEAPLPATQPAPAAPQPTPAAPAPAASAADAKPVNTICAICAMPVDPKVPTATYQGKVIGFGCKACPPKFAAKPDLYGPAALQNRVVEE
jgi:hypothetical protein